MEGQQLGLQKLQLLLQKLLTARRFRMDQTESDPVIFGMRTQSVDGPLEKASRDLSMLPLPLCCLKGLVALHDSMANQEPYAAQIWQLLHAHGSKTLSNRTGALSFCGDQHLTNTSRNQSRTAFFLIPPFALQN